MSAATVAQLRAEADEFVAWAAAERAEPLRRMAQFLRDVADELEALERRVATLEGVSP